MGDIAAEFAGNVPYDISDYYSAGTGIPGSGEISISDFYGASSASHIVASGGSVYDKDGYRYHKFTGNSTFSVTELATGSFSNTLNYLVCGGGGGAAGQYGNCAGGGGGGGGSIDTSRTAALGNHTVAIGARGEGGGQMGYEGGTSSVFGHSAVGGGRGGNYGTFSSGGNGGCGGGGAGGGYSGGTGSQGFNGYEGNSSNLDGGGGGGARENASYRNGGRGKTWLDGTAYGTGGYGGLKTAGFGGNAGGTGNGGTGNGTAVGSGTKAGNGSAGVVVIRYQIA